MISFCISLIFIIDWFGSNQERESHSNLNRDWSNGKLARKK